MEDELDALQFGGQGGRVDEKQATHSIPVQTGKPVIDLQDICQSIRSHLHVS